MSDFLLELRSEEIPARMQAGARDELARLFRREMEAAGVSVGDLTVWSTPRRLALIALDLPQATEAVSEEAKGPPEGAPDAAIDGFCRKNGVTRDQLTLRDVKGRGTWFAVIEKPGRAVKDVLADAIPAIIRTFSWPKSMRWGAASLSTESLRWVRPLSGIVAILGEELVECEVDGIRSGYATMAHRFHHSGEITIGGAHDYAEKLRACHVIVDHAERQDIIRTGAAKVAADAGLTLVEDEGLVIENAGLTEWPVPLLGRFDEAYLDVPPEVIQLTARVNQKYFVCEDSAGKLANAFVCTANIAAADGGAAIVDGNRKVLAARLSDARFFWEQDRKTPLAEHAKKLERITFHEKLGTVADKVERVAKLARWLVEEGVVKGADPDRAEQAARLAKADLVTEMVGEFPELQGLMGGYYARAEGLPDAVADAIRDHYKPVGQGDDVPTAPVTVAVSLADKLDTLVGFFAIDERPSGSKDPFALRRAILGVVSLIRSSAVRGSFVSMFVAAFRPLAWITQLNVIGGQFFKDAPRHEYWLELVRSRDDVVFEFKDSKNFKIHIGTKLISASGSVTPGVVANIVPEPKVVEGLSAILIDRLKVQQREAGVRHDLIDAVFALGGEDDLVRLLARVHALQAFMATEDGANLLAGYKRAANILKKEDWHGIEGEISRTGEEDPLALVDNPDMKAVIDAKMAERHAKSLSYTPEPAEKALIDALDAAEPRAAAAIAAEDFAAAMSALASLRAPIDRFFEDVIVNAEEETKRTARLGLLARFRDAVHRVADFSRIEG
ncbi:glycine--tRNA ligase subunit beta [Parerythrobacter aurantius]|uniref:glycine--tRNA ligase subunit beta n=1 Tax=Parerythrobacter aurantius TaxID=3127706 RepID=UPI0032467ABE